MYLGISSDSITKRQELNSFKGIECEKGGVRKIKNLRVYDLPNTFKFLKIYSGQTKLFCRPIMTWRLQSPK